MNGYIIVLPEGVLSSEHRAERISRELYCVTAPLATQEPYQHDGKVFGMVEHPDGACVYVSVRVCVYSSFRTMSQTLCTSIRVE